MLKKLPAMTTLSPEIREKRSDPVAEMMTEYGVWAFESHHTPSFQMPTTSHAFPKLLFIQEGQGQVLFEKGTTNRSVSIACKSGDCVYVPRFCSHRIIDQPNAPISLYGLGVDLSRLVSTSHLERMAPAGKLAPERVMLLGMRHRMRRLLYLVTQRTASAMLLASAIAIDTFAQLALASEKDRNPKPSPKAIRPGEPLEEYLGWLDSNFFEAISIDEAARACQMSRRTFTTRFRQRTGQTWLAYLNGLRVNYAQTLLENGDANVSSIAFQSGFDDLSTFYRAMKRATGKRPLDFRR